MKLHELITENFGSRLVKPTFDCKYKNCKENGKMGVLVICLRLMQKIINDQFGGAQWGRGLDQLFAEFKTLYPDVSAWNKAVDFFTKEKIVLCRGFSNNFYKIHSKDLFKN